MPAKPSNAEPRSQDSAPVDQQLSRRERRGKGKKQQPLPGVRNPGRVSVPATKHMNYRRG